MPRIQTIKRPSFQWYPGDWLHCPEVRACSLPARGLWIDMLSLMHEGQPYGHLTLNGQAITEEVLAIAQVALLVEVQ